VEVELFPERAYQKRGAGSPSEAPLAERMRPQSLDQFAGQGHLVSADRPLGPLIAGKGRLPSMILWGPPGSGKTTLASLLAHRAQHRFEALSAVMAGVKDLREAVARAAEARAEGRPTALFIDEIHRFNKAQQDALLPYVENGTVVLIGATTENPSFEVIPALRSRCRIFTLEPLGDADLRDILERALADERLGLGRRKLAVEPDALALLCRLASGDARRALGLLETAAERVESRIDRAAVEAALETRLPDYDKGGDQHYDVISAFIKSLRGSDPDAALYWLARMLDAGEDPRFVCRRMLIFASEDVGNADPQALILATAAAEAFDRVGLPEGRLVLAQAATYLACAPKSNASYRALDAASAEVRESGALPVPLHLRNAPTELLRTLGHGKGYVYPHDRPGHFVDAEYLPEALRGKRFYRPSDQGLEVEIAARQHARWRDRQDEDGD